MADVDGLTGRARREAVFKKVYGEELHDMDAKAFTEEGTRSNPIPILSTEPTRIVGISLPDDAEIRWMELRKGELAYDPDTNNYFALKQVRGGGGARGGRRRGGGGGEGFARPRVLTRHPLPPSPRSRRRRSTSGLRAPRRWRLARSERRALVVYCCRGQLFPL